MLADRTTFHGLSYALAKFYIDRCGVEASARSPRGGMRCQKLLQQHLPNSIRFSYG